jgi:hypothetical protein
MAKACCVVIHLEVSGRAVVETIIKRLMYNIVPGEP